MRAAKAHHVSTPCSGGPPVTCRADRRRYRLLSLVHRPVRVPARARSRTSWSPSCRPGAPGRAARRRRGPRAPLEGARLLEGRPRHQHPPHRLRREPARPQRCRRGDGRDLARTAPCTTRCAAGSTTSSRSTSRPRSRTARTRDVRACTPRPAPARSPNSPASRDPVRAAAEHPEMRIETAGKTPGSSPRPRSIAWLEGSSLATSATPGLDVGARQRRTSSRGADRGQRCVAPRRGRRRRATTSNAPLRDAAGHHRRHRRPARARRRRPARPQHCGATRSPRTASTTTRRPTLRSRPRRRCSRRR